MVSKEGSKILKAEQFLAIGIYVKIKINIEFGKEI